MEKRKEAIVNDKNAIQKPVDPAGVELTPGDAEACFGNGKHVDKRGKLIEICCDNCDYFLECYPEWKKGDPNA